MSGHLVQEHITAAFYKDIGSFGRFSLDQDAISDYVVSTSNGYIPSVIGISNSTILGIQVSFQSFNLKGAEKAGI